MTPEEEKTIKRLETRVRQLIMAYQDLKKQKESMRVQMNEQEKTIASLNDQIRIISNKYNNLKLAKTLTLNETEQKEAKGRLNKLLREVDKCIALLKV